MALINGYEIVRCYVIYIFFCNYTKLCRGDELR